jgi:hypothetical protein
MKTRLFSASIILILAFSGCAKKPPPVTAVEGKLLIDDKPLPFAHIEFYPEFADFGSEMNSSAETDERGNFTLTCHANGQPGAAVAIHRVVVIEAAPPKELRGMDAKSQTRLAEHMKKLSNRPIPDAYGNYSKTPLRVTVTAEQRSYTVQMKRETAAP